MKVDISGEVLETLKATFLKDIEDETDPIRRVGLSVLAQVLCEDSSSLSYAKDEKAKLPTVEVHSVEKAFPQRQDLSASPVGRSLPKPLKEFKDLSYKERINILDSIKKDKEDVSKFSLTDGAVKKVIELYPYSLMTHSWIYEASLWFSDGGNIDDFVELTLVKKDTVEKFLSIYQEKIDHLKSIINIEERKKEAVAWFGPGETCKKEKGKIKGIADVPFRLLKEMEDLVKQGGKVGTVLRKIDNLNTRSCLKQRYKAHRTFLPPDFLMEAIALMARGVSSTQALRQLEAPGRYYAGIRAYRKRVVELSRLSTEAERQMFLAYWYGYGAPMGVPEAEGTIRERVEAKAL